MSNYKSLQHTKWECKYHVCVHPEIPKEGDLWRATQASG